MIVVIFWGDYYVDHTYSTRYAFWFWNHNVYCKSL